MFLETKRWEISFDFSLFFKLPAVTGTELTSFLETSVCKTLHSLSMMNLISYVANFFVDLYDPNETKCFSINSFLALRAARLGTLS